MLKKLYMLLVFSNLVVSKLLSCKVIVMHNFVTNFGKILEICKQFAEKESHGTKFVVFEPEEQLVNLVNRSDQEDDVNDTEFVRTSLVGFANQFESESKRQPINCSFPIHKKGDEFSCEDFFLENVEKCLVFRAAVTFRSKKNRLHMYFSTCSTEFHVLFIFFRIQYLMEGGLWGLRCSGCPCLPSPSRIG